MKRQSNSVITVFFLVTLLLTSSSLPFIDASNENKISDKGNSKINDKKDNNTAESYSNANLTNQGKKDKDGDGIVNGKDNCPMVSNPLQVDADGDRVGDLCEVDTKDTDGDGVKDNTDACSTAAGTLPNGCPDPNAVQASSNVEFIDAIVVTGSDTDTQPIANAGVDIFQEEVPHYVTVLNGTESFDPDGDSITFLWSFLSIPNDSEATMPVWPVPTYPVIRFTADVEGEYIAQLVVSDGAKDSTDTVTINVKFLT